MNRESDSSFDPYHRWLGIPPKDQPAHHYRLLGIERFEDDPEVIESAADRQMSHLRTFQIGQRGQLAQQILNELSAAKLCLLDVGKKLAYDERLRAGSAGIIQQVTRPLSVQEPEPATSLDDPMNRADRLAPILKPLAVKPVPAVATRRRTIGANLTKQQWVMIAIGLGGVAVFALAIVLAVMWVSRINDRIPVENGILADIENRSESTVDRSAQTHQLDDPIISNQPLPEENPSDEITVRRAVVEVRRMKSVSFGHVHLLPGEPSDAISYRLDPPPSGASIANGMLEFRVTQTGIVYLVTSTQYQGNRSGGWWEERVTKEQLVESGWTDLGPCPWNRQETLLRREVQAGEDYRIRTNKYGPPQLIIPLTSS